MTNNRFIRFAAVAAPALGAMTAAGPAGAQAQPPSNCVFNSSFVVVGSPAAPTKIVASAYYQCPNGETLGAGEVYIERSVPGSLPVEVASGLPSAVYFCSGTATHSYTNSATETYVTIPCG
jgi:hypothetical protein